MDVAHARAEGRSKFSITVTVSFSGRCAYMLQVAPYINLRDFHDCGLPVCSGCTPDLVLEASRCMARTLVFHEWSNVSCLHMTRLEGLHDMGVWFAMHRC